jgi:hypothetical protein
MRENPGKTQEKIYLGEPNEVCYNLPTAKEIAKGCGEEAAIGADQNENAELPEWLTIQDVAKMRGVSDEAIREAIKDNRLKAKVAYKSTTGRLHYVVHREWALEFDERVARFGRGARKRKLPKTENPGRQELILAAS